MSIVNVAVRHDRAIVAVDTQVSSPIDDAFPDLVTMGHTSKMLPIVHANTVLAVRGSPVFMLIAFNALYEMTADVGIDLIAQVLPGFLNGALSSAPFPESVLAMPQEVWAVGWSRQSDRPRGVVCRRPPGGQFGLEEVGEAIGPQLEGGIPPLWQPEQMAAVARRQVAMQREQQPGTSIGGRLLQAEITAHGMRIDEICDLG